MNDETKKIDDWARKNIPEYRMELTRQLPVRAMIRQARACKVDDIYNLVTLARLFLHTNIEIAFSQESFRLNNKMLKDRFDSINAFTRNGVINLDLYISKSANAVLLHELTRAKEHNMGSWSFMTLEGESLS